MCIIYWNKKIYLTFYFSIVEKNFLSFKTTNYENINLKIIQFFVFLNIYEYIKLNYFVLFIN